MNDSGRNVRRKLEGRGIGVMNATAGVQAKDVRGLSHNGHGEGKMNVKGESVGD